MNDQDLKNMTIQEVIITGLDFAWDYIKKTNPYIRNTKYFMPFEFDTNPANLKEFMLKYDIPDNCFICKDRDDDVLGLGWEEDVIIPKVDQLFQAISKFKGNAHISIYNLLTKLGYKRRAVGVDILHTYNSHDLYELYINKEWDKLERYFLRFYDK